MLEAVAEIHQLLPMTIDAVITGPRGARVPVIPFREALCPPKRDGRDIGERSDAVLRTAMPGHDGEI